MNNVFPAIPLFPEHKLHHTHKHRIHPPIHLHPPHNQPFPYRAHSQAPIVLPSNGTSFHSGPYPVQRNIQAPLSQSSQFYQRGSNAQISQAQSRPMGPIITASYNMSQSQRSPVFISQTPSYIPQSNNILGQQLNPQVLSMGSSQLPQSRPIGPAIASSYMSQSYRPPMMSQSQITSPYLPQPQTNPLSSSQIFQSGPPVQREATIFEYVPFEIPYEEQYEVERIVKTPVEKRLTDYYAIENQIEYVPITTYETIREMVPQTRTEYIAQTKVNYIPQIIKETVTVPKTLTTVEYVPRETRTIRYPEFEGQYTADAENYGNVALKNSQIVGNSGFYVSSGVKSPAMVQERFFLKKLDKDIRKLEKETKLQRSQSNSPEKKDIKKTEKASRLQEDSLKEHGEVIKE